MRKTLPLCVCLRLFLLTFHGCLLRCRSRQTRELAFPLHRLCSFTSTNENKRRLEYAALHALFSPQTTKGTHTHTASTQPSALIRVSCTAAAARITSPSLFAHHLPPPPHMRVCLRRARPTPELLLGAPVQHKSSTAASRSARTCTSCGVSFVFHRKIALSAPQSSSSAHIRTHTQRQREDGSTSLSELDRSGETVRVRLVHLGTLL